MLTAGGRAPLMLAIPSTVLAQTNTFYVSPAGSDQNEGSINAPWQTLRYAVARLRPGTTLYLRSGTYTGPANTIDSQSGTVPSGTSWSNAVTIAGYPGETATIQPPNLSAIRLTFTAPHYLVFQDFTIDLSNQVAGSPDDAVYLSQGAHHNRFLRMTVQHTLNMRSRCAAGTSPSASTIVCSPRLSSIYPAYRRRSGPRA